MGLILFFASQGAGRLFWPVLANLGRLTVAAGGGWLALVFGGGLVHVFFAQAAALVVYGMVNAAAIAGGAWFGPVLWPSRITNEVMRFWSKRRLSMMPARRL